MNTKRILIFLFLIFNIALNIFSIDNYKIELGKIRVNDSKYSSVVTPHVWQPWQKMDFKLTIDENKKDIVTYFDIINKYTYFKVEYKITKEYNNSTYYTKDNYIIDLYKMNNGEIYLLINDVDSKIELFYKLIKE